MSLITKTNPVGIDYYIQKFQSSLYTALKAKWSMSDSEYFCTGRAYRNKTKDGYIAELYSGNNQYQEVFWNAKYKAVSFFGISGPINEASVKNQAEIHLVFFVNLQKVKPSITHRADEEVRQDVYNVASKQLFDFSFQGVDLWLENVLAEYPGSRREKYLAAVDMHPVHCFRLNYNLIYDPKKVC